MAGYATALTEALADPDPWHAFTRYIEAMLRAFAAPGAPLAESPSSPDLYRAMARSGRPPES